MENTNMERMREIEVFGVPALFTVNRVPHDAVYPGMFRYELQDDREIPSSPRYLSDAAPRGFLGTILTPVAITMMGNQREIEPGDLFLDIDAGYYTPEEFEEKYLSPSYDPDAERYGKAD